MDLKQIVLLALQISILCTVFVFGLQATYEDLMYLLRRPGLLARSLLSVFVLMPIVAVALVTIFDFPRPVEIVIIALSISPVPPLLPQREGKAGGHHSYGLALMALLSLVSIVVVPGLLVLVGVVFGRHLSIAPSVVAGIIVKAALIPLLAGMIVRGFFPALADRLVHPVSLVVRVLMPVAALALIAAAFSTMWALVGSGTVIALGLFTVAGLAIGHFLGGPDPAHSAVLALSSACRHPAIALTVAATNFPDLRFGAIILLYVIVNALVGIPYLRRQRAQTPAAVGVA